ncbi:MAG: DUF3034 family protein [Porticoccaceae bacterium]|nr:DUF3034 family protein [Porticoccaceae bacterium]
MPKRYLHPLAALFIATLSFQCLADSRILATSGATQLEGAAGGGLVPWAVIAGYGDEGEWGGSLAATRVSVDDFQLDATSINIGINNRFEMSLSHHNLKVEPLNLNIRQDIIGLKIKLLGDLIYNSLPQISSGVQYKRNHDELVPFLLGAKDDTGTDYYLSASKLYLNAIMGRNLLINVTGRWTEANQIGLLGFGGHDNGHTLQAEASVGLLINRHWVVGMEYRQKPDNLKAVDEDDWQDVFIGWFPNKHLSTVLAYSDLGDIAGLPNQSGWYLSFQLVH